jgi:hypothetical protein
MTNIRIHATLRTAVDRLYGEWAAALLPRGVIEQTQGPLGTIEYQEVDPRFVELLRGQGIPFAELRMSPLSELQRRVAHDLRD